MDQEDMICQNCKKAEAEIFGNGMDLCNNCNESIDTEMDKLRGMYRSRLVNCEQSAVGRAFMQQYETREVTIDRRAYGL